jgi:putative hydrolase of the HAD superfamily
MIRSIVFDIGGVVLRSEDESGREALGEKYDLEPGWVETLVFRSAAALASTIGMVSADAIWTNLAEKLSLTESEMIRFQEQFWQGDRIDRHLVSFLMNCRPHYKTAFLTNAWKGARAVLKDTHGLSEGTTVDHLLISSEIGLAKPDHKIYMLLAKTLDCQLNEILFVDDFIENIIAANELGIHTIHFNTGIDLINVIKSRLKQ